MDALARKAFEGLVGMFLVMGVLLFGIARTLDWWQAWLCLAVYFGCSIALTLFMYAKDRALLERRMRGGPLAEKEPTQRLIMSIASVGLAEKEPTQRLIMSIASVGFAGLIIVPAFDRRFGWSDMPPAIAIVGDITMALGWLAIYFVFRENNFTSATIEMAADQKVVSTGPYARVRHPMYAGALPMLLGIPIALGSWWGTVPFFVILPALIWRIFNEESFLTKNLAGYDSYKQKVRYRLIPHLW